MADISEIIGNINQIQVSIATAVGEQSEASASIGTTVQDAAKQTNTISDRLSEVSQMVEDTAHGAQTTQQAGKELARLASELKSLVNHFRLEEQVQTSKDYSLRPTNFFN